MMKEQAGGSTRQKRKQADTQEPRRKREPPQVRKAKDAALVASKALLFFYSRFVELVDYPIDTKRTNICFLNALRREEIMKL